MGDAELLKSKQPLQAILLADSFTRHFRPMTLDTPKVGPSPFLLHPPPHHSPLITNTIPNNTSSWLVGADASVRRADDRVYY